MRGFIIIIILLLSYNLLSAQKVNISVVDGKTGKKFTKEAPVAITITISYKKISYTTENGYSQKIPDKINVSRKNYSYPLTENEYDQYVMDYDSEIEGEFISANIRPEDRQSRNFTKTVVYEFNASGYKQLVLTKSYRGLSPNGIIRVTNINAMLFPIKHDEN